MVIGYLGRQGLPFQGHDETKESKTRDNLKNLVQTLPEEKQPLKET